ncbi:winged helix-turn-helix transcriptional regulator [candidate division KSB1 bacterium]|nr:winged helix-turn-helix transcriptional regulator [candidate division KSB1 bacterium]
MREFLNIVNALSDANRLRLFLSLRDRELCVCNLVDFIGLADSTVSKHLAILRDAGLVDARKCGKWVYYRLAGPNASPLVRQVVQLAREALAGDPAVVADETRLVGMLSRADVMRCLPDASPCPVDDPQRTPAMQKA